MIVLLEHFFLELLKLLFYSIDEYSISFSLILLLLVILCIFPKQKGLNSPQVKLEPSPGSIGVNKGGPSEFKWVVNGILSSVNDTQIHQG